MPLLNGICGVSFGFLLKEDMDESTIELISNGKRLSPSRHLPCCVVYFVQPTSVIRHVGQHRMVVLSMLRHLVSQCHLDTSKLARYRTISDSGLSLPSNVEPFRKWHSYPIGLQVPPKELGPSWPLLAPTPTPSKRRYARSPVGSE